MPLAYLIDSARFKVAITGSIIKSDAFKALNDARALIKACEELEAHLLAEGREAHEAARLEGLAQGRRDADAQCAQRLTEIELEAARYLGALDDKLARLVMQVIRRIAPRVGARQIVPDLVEEALKEVRAERFLVIRVHPDCCDAVNQRLREIKQAYPMFDLVDVHADPDIDPFACSLESEAGIVRADLDVQLAAIERALHQSLESRKAAGQP
jgi:type III secretion protein L